VEDVVEPGDALLAVDTRVGNFRIRRLLGEGAMGQVYLAQDATLGRRVALKLIKRSVMERHGTERFLEEARATASLNHPHIVTLHAVGEHDGRPYLALEYIDGESLRARLGGGPLPLREALRYCRAVAEAIAEAHRHRLIHADLKPENIVIPRDGRVRVVDFGLARLAGDAPQAASGTPAYMAPERWRGLPPTGAIDIWALGVTLHELVVGSRPISDAALPHLAFTRAELELAGLPEAPWAQLVRDCLVLDPAARPTAEAVVRRLTGLLDPHAAAATAPADDDARCPFPGLAAFSRDDAADYFGRAEELDAAVEQLREHPLIPVVGPSGIGKSSFIRAALLPRLDEAARWVVVAMRPGASPFDSLAAALAIPDYPADAIADALRRYPDSLSLALAEVARHHDARVLLFVDQFEETFTLGDDPDAVAFCDCLARAALAAEPWRIVLTLRDDFLGRLAAAPSMRPHLGAVMVLAPLSTADLRAAVAGPLGNAGYEPDAPELVTRIVGDIDGQPACLPLLQFTCRSLWERRDVAARRVLVSEYEAMGGATGALATHAQRLMTELAADEVRLVRGILLALVHPDGTRRPCRRSELLDGMPAGAHGAVGGLVDRLVERRLVVATRDVERDDATLEVAHEALATAWPQLAHWLDETYEQRVLVTDLAQASVLWQRRNEDDDATWGGASLTETVRKVSEWNVTLPPGSRAFLDACVRRDRRLRRRRHWLIGGIMGLLAAAVVIAGLFARYQQHRRYAAEDWGTFDLELEPFNWDTARQAAVPLSADETSKLGLVATLSHATTSREVDKPYERDEIERGTPAWRAEPGTHVMMLVERVKARSGAAILEVSARGGACPPSVVYLKGLPGYSGSLKHGPATIHLRIPTCTASAAGMVEIPAGDFHRNSAHDEDGRASLAAFQIDRTEVTREAFAVYGALEPLTGDRSTTGPGSPDQRLARLPIVGIDHVTAQAYCRYLGKDLPTAGQWQKAFRGGLVIDGHENPAPRRQTPWQPWSGWLGWLPWRNDVPHHPANLAYDGNEDAAPVGSFPVDTSPYGVVDLAGNVSEWSRTPAEKSEYKGLQAVLGANWDTKPGTNLLRRNLRHPRYFDFVIGVRCVVEPPPVTPARP
jgi:formylglycine-generating enzyme required for sulfatase activity/tRNA A-37 threonylcarbamoyl transferase component Bud32